MKNCKGHQFCLLLDLCNRWRRLGLSKLDEKATLCVERNGVLVAPRSGINVSVLAKVVQQGAVQATRTQLPTL